MYKENAKTPKNRANESNSFRKKAKTLKIALVGITLLLVIGTILIFTSRSGSSETSNTENDGTVVPFLPVWIALIASTGTNAKLQPKDAKQKSILIAIMVLTILATLGTIILMLLR